MKTKKYRKDGHRVAWMASLAGRHCRPISAGAAGTVKVFMIPKFTGIAPFTDAATGCKTEGKSWV